MSQRLDEHSNAKQPRSFEEILGHERWRESVLANLKSDICSKSDVSSLLHQPFALIGASGVGKTTLAKLYARALVCMRDLDERIDAAPCGDCDECRAMLRGSSLAFVEVDARRRDGDVDDEREWEEVQGERLQEAIKRDGRLNTAPVRVVVINNAEDLKGFNADIALKTLERELGSSLYIFVVNDAKRFSAALRSRCSVYRVGPISMDDLLAGLSVVCTERRVRFDKGAIRAIAVAAAGSFGDALTIMARVEEHGDVSMENLLRIPEFSWGSTMLACWQAVLDNQLEEAVTLFESIGSDGPIRIRAMQAFLSEFRIRYKMGGLPVAASAALDCIQSKDWTPIFASWTAWCRDRAVEPDEALEQLLNFWATVRLVTSSKLSFYKGCEVLTSRRLTVENCLDGGAKVLI